MNEISMEPGPPLDFPGITMLSIGLHFHRGSADSLSSVLEREFRFAQDEGYHPREWLNRLKFNAEDFGATQRGEDVLLTAGIVYLGLKTGHSFELIRRNLSVLELEATLRCPNDEPGPFDNSELTQLRSSVFKNRTSLESIDQALRVVIAKVRTDDVVHSPAVDAACFSALASFLCQQKIVIDSAQILRIRSELETPNLIFELLSPSGLGVSSNKLNYLRHPPVLTTTLNSTPILKLPVNKIIDGCKDAVKIIDRIVTKNIAANGQYFREAMPTETERAEAVAIMQQSSNIYKLLGRAQTYLRESLEARQPHGFPDHDRRHILFAIPATALRLGEQQSPYIQIFGSFCCLLHDAGRILETHFDFNDSRKELISDLHPKISAAAAIELLEDFPDLPQRVRDEIIIAVATHDLGSATNSCLAQFTQSVDRLQLIGPEVFIRQIGITSACKKLPFYPKLEDPPASGKSVFGAMGFYLHNLYPNIGSNTDIELRLAVASGTLLRLASLGTPYEGHIFMERLLARANWKSLPCKLEEQIDRDFVIVKHESSNVFENYSSESAKTPHMAAHEYIDELLRLQLVSSLDFLVAGRSARLNLRDQINEAQKLSPQFPRALRYGLISARLYDKELIEEVNRIALTGSEPQKVLAELIKISIQ